jgi:hypothetical protein
LGKFSSIETEVTPKVKHFVVARQGFADGVGHETLCLQGFPGMLADGRYDALIVDVDAHDDDRRVATIELVIVGGSQKGDVVSLRTTRLAVDPWELLGLPATLIVEDGEPRMELD